jgi:LDH2 family malate/lactate/ureidoglycolate dehydrogenase
MKDAMRYPAAGLVQFAREILMAAGLSQPLAEATAETLVEGDLLGHDTHGLALLEPYVNEIASGKMTRSGAARVVSEKAAVLLWDGQRLPGPWLVRAGLDELSPRAKQNGSATLVIRRSHHIACLATYLVRAARDGLFMLLASSDPAVHSVAPHGGTRGVFTPNPIAAGIPTSQDPILVDISASITTNGMSARLHRENGRFEEAWLLDAQGVATNDPGVLYTDPPGTILPLGGLSAGHKGFGLALLIEALTGGLAGLGRADPLEGWGATVFMMLFDPDAFGGRADFARQMDAIVTACHDNPARPGFEGVRMPGERGLRLWREQLRDGVRLRDGIASSLKNLGTRYALDLPAPS